MFVFKSFLKGKQTICKWKMHASASESTAISVCSQADVFPILCCCKARTPCVKKEIHPFLWFVFSMVTSMLKPPPAASSPPASEARRSSAGQMQPFLQPTPQPPQVFSALQHSHLLEVLRVNTKLKQTFSKQPKLGFQKEMQLCA